MAVSKNINFTRTQLKKFARLFRAARLRANLSQLEVAQKAFGYEVSHCKVSRVERVAMPKVDAHALEAMAQVLNVPAAALKAIDPQFKDRAIVIREATRRGFWHPRERSIAPELCVR